MEHSTIIAYGNKKQSGRFRRLAVLNSVGGRIWLRRTIGAIFGFTRFSVRFMDELYVEN